MVGVDLTRHHHNIVSKPDKLSPGDLISGGGDD